jgi:hypothetical protein
LSRIPVMNFSNKFIIFLLGLSLGLLVGAGFFIFKIDDYISKLELFKSSPDTVVTVNEDKNANDKLKDQKNTNWTQVKKTEVKDSTPLTKNDTTNISEVNTNDSTRVDSNLTAYNGNQEEIVVRKDELVTARSIDVNNVSGTDVKNPKDSLLQKESGIKDVSKDPVTAYQVEFWQSPINYKGYKMLKNKIVLFGIAQSENLKLYKIEDALYMKQQQNVYRLAFTSDFRQFESVKDQSVLAKIK